MAKCLLGNVAIDSTKAISVFCDKYGIGHLNVDKIWWPRASVLLSPGRFNCIYVVIDGN